MLAGRSHGIFAGGAGERTWALDVADDGTGLVVYELDAALSDTTTGACLISVSLHSLI
jgi:hypothetical protein